MVACWTLNGDPQFEVNGARKVKSDATNNNSDPRAEFFSLGVAGENGAPTEIFPNFRKLSKTSRAGKLIFGLQVNTDNNIIHRKPTVTQ